MRWLRFAVFILIVTILQASMVDVIAVSHLNIKPDLLLILMVFFAIFCNQQDAIITSFTIGFAADLIGSAMGPRIISFGIFGTLLSYLHGVITIKKKLHQSLVIFISSLLTGIMVNLLTILKEGQPITANVYIYLFWTSIYSSIVGPFLFLPMAWCMRIKTYRSGLH